MGMSLNLTIPINRFSSPLLGFTFPKSKEADRLTLFASNLDASLNSNLEWTLEVLYPRYERRQRVNRCNAIILTSHNVILEYFNIKE